jgi:sulfonate transport system permease protein
MTSASNPSPTPQEQARPKAVAKAARKPRARLVAGCCPSCCWCGRSQAGWLSSRILPEPFAVLKALESGGLGELWRHLAVSSGRAASGFVGGGWAWCWACSPAAALGRTLLDTTLQMVRNIPALALIPLVILWFGIDETAKLFLVAVGVFFPVYLNTFHGIRSVDQGLIGAQLRPVGLAAVSRRDPAGRLPSILVGCACAGPDVGAADRGRDHLGPGRHRLHDHECPRVPADRCGAGGHPALRLLGKLADTAARATLLALASGYQ